MRVWICFALLPCALLAQTSPPRPADQDVLKRLQQRLDWFHPSVHPPQSDWKARLFGSPQSAGLLAGGVAAVTTPPRTCSIPLLRVPMAEGIVDRMSLPMPPGKDFDPKFVLPTPPVCEAWKP